MSEITGMRCRWMPASITGWRHGPWPVRTLLAMGVAGLLLAALIASLASCAAPSPPAPLPDNATVIRVEDEHGEPVTGAVLYAARAPQRHKHTGKFVTDSAGKIILPSTPTITSAVALKPVALVESTRGFHDQLDCGLLLSNDDSPDGVAGCDTAAPSWAYQVYLTSLVWDDLGSPQAAVIERGAVNTLHIQSQHPLILFNLLVSIEWDATEEYIEQFAEAMQKASAYLWDLTDGQMAFGQVTIADRRAYWHFADIQVLARNTEYPHASIDGLERVVQPAKYRIQLAPFWDKGGVSPQTGHWNAPDGFRTIAHEFGHYAFGLYDEYVDRNYAKAHCTVEKPQQVDRNYAKAHCTVEKPQQDENSTTASAMYWQYTTSEFSAQGVPELWSDACEDTMQWWMTYNDDTNVGLSAWEALAERYEDCASPPRWQIVTPMSHPTPQAAPGPQPAQWPAALPILPIVDRSLAQAQDGSVLAPFTMTTQGKTSLGQLAGGGQPRQTRVYLQMHDHPCAINLGSTDQTGQLLVFAARAGDVIRAEDDQFCGLLSISDAMSQTPILTMSFPKSKGCQKGMTICSDSQDGASEAGSGLYYYGLIGEINPWGDTDNIDWQLGERYREDVVIVDELRNTGGMIISKGDLVASLHRHLEQVDESDLAIIADVLACLPHRGANPQPCVLLDVGFNTLPDAAKGVGSLCGVERAPQTLASSDGRAQVLLRPGELPEGLRIIDSPAPGAGWFRDGQDLATVSRMFTFSGFEDSLLVQIQSECCPGNDAAESTALYEIDRGENSRNIVEGSRFFEQEGYILAVIDRPGAYVVCRSQDPGDDPSEGAAPQGLPDLRMTDHAPAAASDLLATN